MAYEAKEDPWKKLRKPVEAEAPPIENPWSKVQVPLEQSSKPIEESSPKRTEDSPWRNASKRYFRPQRTPRGNLTHLLPYVLIRLATLGLLGVNILLGLVFVSSYWLQNIILITYLGSVSAILIHYFILMRADNS